MKRVTIYDVAREANVSLATVSRVINGSDVVKEATRNKVQDAITKLGYKPNAIAQGLALQRTTTIGLIIPEASFTYIGQIINGLLDVAKIYNYNVMLHTITEGITDAEKIVDVIIKSRVDGVIVYSDKMMEDSITTLNSYNIPIVMIANKASGESLCSVYIDIAKAIRELCNRYIGYGVTDIAVLEDRKNRNSSRLMAHGAKQAFEANGLSWNNYIEIPNEYRSTYRFVRKYFEDHRHGLVIAYRDSQAMAVLNSARENGIAVPDDMEVVCFVDTKYNSAVRPMISSFSIPSYDLGAVSMRVMTKMLENDRVTDKEKCLSYLYTARQTTKHH